jgi:hypothetical protein
MTGKNRGQVMVEYLVTYGWAFIVIATTIGALSYFGIINPGRWLPDQCDVGQQLVCQDYELDSGAGTIKLFVRNNFGKEITITNAIVRTDGADQGTIAGDVAFLPNEVKEVVMSDVNLPTQVLFPGAKRQVKFEITMHRTGGSQDHVLTGILYATAK